MAEKKFLHDINLMGSALRNTLVNSNENTISNITIDDLAPSTITSDLLVSDLATQLATASAITSILPHYGKIDVIAATTGTITLPDGSVAVGCFALEPGPPKQRIEIGWSVTGNVLTWETGGVAIDASIIVQWVFNFAILT